MGTKHQDKLSGEYGYEVASDTAAGKLTSSPMNIAEDSRVCEVPLLDTSPGFWATELERRPRRLGPEGQSAARPTRSFEPQKIPAFRAMNPPSKMANTFVCGPVSGDDSPISFLLWLSRLM